MRGGRGVTDMSGEYECVGAANQLLGERYLLKEQLGKGGGGSVYLCYDRKLHKDWAVKELREPTDIERSMELELLKTISCNLFPRIVDVVKNNGRIFIVMDYVEGITLKEKMRCQILTEKDVLPWAMQIAVGINYLHRMTPSILYMDCKPDNIIVTDTGEIRLIDLGSAYVCLKDKKQRIGGTRFFAPKEQRNRQKDNELPDARVDIYAFGMTLYYLLTGGKKEWRKNGRLCVKEVNPNISWGMSHIIEKCTMDNPEDRYQTMEEVVDQLKHIRRIGKWKAGRVRINRTLVLTGKVGCACIVLWAACQYRLNENVQFVVVAILAFSALLPLNTWKRVTMFEINRDIFCGTGKRILYLFLLVTGLISVVQITTYASNQENMKQIEKDVYEESDLEVILHDSHGRKILIKDGSSWGVEEDIIIRIPIEEIHENDGEILISYTNEGEENDKKYLFKCYRK